MTSQWWRVEAKVGNDTYEVPVFAINVDQAKRYAFFDWFIPDKPWLSWGQVVYVSVVSIRDDFQAKKNGRKFNLSEEAAG